MKSESVKLMSKDTLRSNVNRDHIFWNWVGWKKRTVRTKPKQR